MGNMGLCYAALKQYDKAIELQEKCLAIYEEFDDKKTLADTCVNLGLCLSNAGQHDRAVACLKRACADIQHLNDEMDLAFAALRLGVALWTRARAEHHQAAPDATSRGGVSAASADTLQEAETWLRTALDMADKLGCLNYRMDAQIHLAYVVMMNGDEDEACLLYTSDAADE